MRLPVQCFGADVHKRGVASAHTNQFSLLDVEDGVDTRFPDDPVAASADDDDDD